METKKINLLKYRGNDSSLFTGRPQGEASRKELNIDANDKKGDKIVFIIPKGTSSINPSFYLGLLYDSIKYFGIDKYEEYYSFEIEDTNEITKGVLLENLQDGKRNALNTLTGNSGLSRFLKKK